jgi:ribonuclease Z
MKFSLTILGSGAAVPTKKRNPTSQLLNIRNKLILIDCGEGTQLQLTRFGIPIQKISHIFISHMHGDHYYGLPGLLSKFQLLGRERKLDLYGPPGVKEVLEVNFRHSNTKLAYPLDFHSLNFEAGREICSNEQFTVSTIPLLHSVPTNGFLFREQPLKRNIRKDFVRKYKIPVPEFENIKSGEDYVDEKGKVHFNEDITHRPAKPRSYAYCTDTAYSESIPGLIKGSDLLYHEATFDEKLKDTAHKKLHATAKQAAEIAKRAEAKKLLIGHFSARYKEVDLLVRQAREIFPETYAAEDGETYEV